MDRCCSRCLEGEPFLQTSATEGVEAVEERERLVEEIGADLKLLAGASWLQTTKAPRRQRTRRWFLRVVVPSFCPVVWGALSSAPFPSSFTTPNLTTGPQLTEHVNSFSRSPCTPPSRSPSAIATQLSRQPNQRRCMPVLLLAVTS